MSSRVARIGDGLAVLGGLAVIGFSFGPFVVMRLASFTSWEWHLFMAPLTWFVVAAAVAAALIAAWRLAGARHGGSLGRAEVALTCFAALVLLGYALSRKYVIFVLTGDESLPLLPHADPQPVRGGPFEVRLDWGALGMLASAWVALGGAVLNRLVRRARRDPEPMGDE